MLLSSAIVDFHLLYMMYDEPVDMQIWALLTKISVESLILRWLLRTVDLLIKVIKYLIIKCNYESVKIHIESQISKIHWMNAVIVWRHFGLQSCVTAPIEWTSTTVCYIVFCQFRYFKLKCEKWKAWGFYQCMVFISFYINSNLCVFHLEQITDYLVKWYRWTRASWFYLYMYN